MQRRVFEVEVMFEYVFHLKKIKFCEWEREVHGKTGPKFSDLKNLSSKTNQNIIMV